MSAESDLNNALEKFWTRLDEKKQVLCKAEPSVYVHDEDYDCDICLGPTPVRELIKKWRDEAALIRKQTNLVRFSLDWRNKDTERIDVLEKCANELEAIL